MTQRLSKVVTVLRGDVLEIRFYKPAARGRHALHKRVHTTVVGYPALLGGDNGNPELLLPAKRK